MRLLLAQLRQYWFSIVLIAAIVYFLLAALQGNLGFFQYIQLSAQIERANEELAIVKAEADRYANLTHRLSDQYLDLDLLDEEARAKLGFIHANERIIR